MCLNRLVITALTAVIFSGISCHGQAIAGAVAPDFTLRNLNGKYVSLREQSGKVVFVEFWASWCPPCRNSMPEVEKIYDQFRDQNVAVYGINLETDAQAVKKFVSKRGIRYPVLMGDKKVAADYRVSSIPVFFIIGPDSRIKKKYTGYRPGMEEEWASEIRNLLKPAPVPADPASPAK